MKMDLANKDPSSPEYNKILNIIKTNDKKIAEYDKEKKKKKNGE